MSQDTIFSLWYIYWRMDE